MIGYGKYIDGIISGEIPAGKYIIKAVNRHVEDIKKSKSKAYPYYFNEYWAKRYINFIKVLRLQKGSNAKFPLQPFQEFVNAVQFGWRNKKTEVKRFEDALFFMPKKNAKSTLISAMATAEWYLESDKRDQYLFAATSRDQANIVFEFAQNMCKDLVKDSIQARDRIKVWSNSVEHKRNGSIMKSISKEAGNVEGKGGRVVVFDEFHLQDNDKLYTNIKSGMMDSRETMFWRITTAGHNTYSPCKEYYDYCKNVLDGKVENDNLFAMLWELDEEDDWKDPDMWAKVNPLYPNSPRHKNLENSFREALDLGGEKEVSFKIKHLNKWVDSSVTWISDEAWMRCKGVFPSHLKDLPVTGGLDLASSRDFSVYSKLYHDVHKDVVYIKNEYYYPFDSLKKLGVKFHFIKLWAEQNLITTTLGEVTDYDMIEEDIYNDTSGNYKFLYYDQFNSNQLIVNLTKRGFNNMSMLPMSAKYMNDPIGEFERLVLNKKIIHDGDPILRWMLGNARIVQGRGKARFITKENDDAKIDGVVSALLSVAAGMHVKSTIQKQAPKIHKLT